MTDIIRAERATVTFFDGLTVEGYRMPDGEFRIGLAGAGLMIGYQKNWLGRILSKQTGNVLKTLQGMGFSGVIIETGNVLDEGSTTRARTISLDDFNRCIIYGVQQKKPAAIALSQAFTKLALIDFFREAFGEHPLSIEEKRQLFYETYAASISPEQWHEMDKQDIINLALAGDESQFKWGLWNR